MVRFLVALLALVAGVSVPDDIVTARLMLDRTVLSAGGSTYARLELIPAAGWHLYGPEHGDAGVPPDIAWTLPSSLRAGRIAFPRSTRVVAHAMTTYEYHGPVVLRVVLSASSVAMAQRDVPIRADVTWVACSHVCAPGHATLRANIDIR
jgi:thiol:disulfide interchange protein DsbD